MTILRRHKTVFTYEWPKGRKGRRKCKRFVRQALKACSYDLARAPFRVTLRFTNSSGLNFYYRHSERLIAIPKGLVIDNRNNWGSVWIPALIHELGHALDFQCLSEAERDRFFEEATGLEANWHYQFHGLQVPAHMEMRNGKPFRRTASWLHSDWRANVCETWADTFLAAFTDLGTDAARHTYRVNNSLITTCREMLP